MKRALYLVFLAWIALQSAFVQAHGVVVGEDRHPAIHIAHHVDHHGADAGTEEHCDTVICAHSIGVLSIGQRFELAPQSFLAPATARALTSIRLLDDIERPKWPTTAPGVAGI